MRDNEHEDEKEAHALHLLQDEMKARANETSGDEGADVTSNTLCTRP